MIWWFVSKYSFFSVNHNSETTHTGDGFVCYIIRFWLFLAGYMTDKQSNICNRAYVSLSSNTMRATIIESLYIWWCEQLTRNPKCTTVGKFCHKPHASTEYQWFGAHQRYRWREREKMSNESPIRRIGISWTHDRRVVDTWYVIERINMA